MIDGDEHRGLALTGDRGRIWRDQRAVARYAGLIGAPHGVLIEASRGFDKANRANP
jgi:hypothetical protein